MKRLFSSFSFDEHTRKIFIFTIYGIFLVFNIYKIIETPIIEGKIAYSLLSSIILSISIYAKYLRSIYVKLIKALNFECDIIKAAELKEKLFNKDIFKNYKNSILIFDTLYNLDQGKYHENIELLKQNQKFFKGSLDYLLIRNYTYFISCYYLKKRNEVYEYYQQLQQLKGAKIKGKKINPLYNWELIDAIYFLTLKEDKKANKAFQAIDPVYFNNRELAFYYLEFGRCLMRLNKVNEAKKCFNQCIIIANNTIYKAKATQLLQGEEK